MITRLERNVTLLRKRAGVGLVTPKRAMPRQLHPETIAVDYWKDIQTIVDQTRRVINRDLVPFLKHFIEDNAREVARKDAADGGLNERFHRLMRQTGDMLRPRELETVTRMIAQRTSTQQKTQLNAQVRAALGVDLDLMAPEVKGQIASFTADNVSLIRSMPVQYLNGIEKDTMRAVRTGERWESLATKLEERYEIATNRARLIARDQVGKLYGELNQKRQEAMGVTAYIWRTSNDGRVREEHADREGERFEWDNPPDDGNPGEPINCRCYGEPDFSNIVEGLSSPD